MTQEQGGQSESVIVVGAASKGIIQRDHQHNAVVFKQTYAANPFSGQNDDDMEKYQQQINNKAAPAGAQLGRAISVRLLIDTDTKTQAPFQPIPLRSCHLYAHDTKT